MVTTKRLGLWHRALSLLDRLWTDRRLHEEPRTTNGMLERAIDSRLRRAVADALSVSPSDLGIDVSLVDDLAADSLDLLEVVAATERELGVSLDDDVLGTLRTYGDLLRLVVAAIAAREERDTAAAEPVPVRWRIGTADAPADALLERCDVLTPYAVSLLVADVARAQRDAVVELFLPEGASAAVRTVADHAVARSRARGVTIRTHFGAVGAWDRRTPDDPTLPTVLDTAVTLTTRTAALARALREERALVARSIMGAGGDVREMMTQQRIADARLVAFRSSVDAHAIALPPTTRSLLQGAHAALDDLATVRTTAPVRPSPGALSAYGQANRRLLDVVGNMADVVAHTDAGRPFVAFAALLEAIEATGLERLELARLLTADDPAGSDAVEVRALIAEQQTHLQAFLDHAPPDAHHAYTACTQDPVFREVARIERLALEQPSATRHVEPDRWFDLMSTKLARLHDLERVQEEALAGTATVHH